MKLKQIKINSYYKFISSDNNYNKDYSNQMCKVENIKEDDSGVTYIIVVFKNGHKAREVMEKELYPINYIPTATNPINKPGKSYV